MGMWPQPHGSPLGPLAQSLADLPAVHKRLDLGQQFNAYQIDDGDDDWVVALGPVNDVLWLGVTNWQCANLIVDALRFAAGQPEQVCRAFPGKASGADG